MSIPPQPSYQREAKERKRRQIITRSTRWILAVVMVGGGLITLLFFTKLFDVRSVEVHASSLIPATDVEQKAWEVLNSRVFGIPRKNNILFFSPQKIGPALLKAFPRIDSVDIRRSSLHKLVIMVHERVAAGLWCLSGQGQCFYYDADGIAFSEIASTSGFLFVPVNDARDRTIEIGHPIAPDFWRYDILEAKKILQFGGLNASQFMIPHDSFNEFDVQVAEGWSILYSTDFDINRQTNNLLAFLKEKITPDQRKKLDYIDLRVEDRIYYKMR